MEPLESILAPEKLGASSLCPKAVIYFQVIIFPCIVIIITDISFQRAILLSLQTKGYKVSCLFNVQ